MDIIIKPTDKITITLSPAELDVVRYILADEGAGFQGWLQQLFDLTLDNIMECDTLMKEDTIPAINHVLKLLRKL